MIQELRNKISEANKAYRLGTPIISDSKYDQLIEDLSLLSPDDELLTKVGISIDDSRKSRLPIEMASMNKIKSMGDLDDWCRLKRIPKNEIVIITPKFDGISLCVNELTNEAYTRGDGEFGQKSDEHYSLLNNKLKDAAIDCEKYEKYFAHKEFSYGEVMMSKSMFLSKYTDFANPRNLVGGLMNSKDVSPYLKDCDYIKYGFVSFSNDMTVEKPFDTKFELISFLNKNQKVKVNSYLCKISDLTEELLITLFHRWSTEYEIDGVIIEINDLRLQEKLGRETSSNNPVWARAFKHPSFEQSAETEIIGITWNISKQGYLKPTLHIKPVRLNGCIVSNVTGNNARSVKDLGLGIGAIVLVKRSGMVIPLITDVIKSVDFIMPDVPNIGWNDNGVELVTLTETDEQKLKKLIAFFEILEAKNISEGVITQLWNAGYTTIKDILNLTISDLEKIDRFGKRKASIVYNSIQLCIKNVTLSKLQHATGFFVGLGSKKLLLLEHFTTKPSLEEVMSIEGFAEKSAESYINGYDKFNDFVKDLPIGIKSKVETVDSITNDLQNMVVVYTGIRDKISEDIICSRGGKIGSGVSKSTTHLVCKDPNSNSSKLEKAKILGINIITLDDLNILLKK